MLFFSPSTEIIPGVKRLPLPYPRYQTTSRDGDILLFEPDGCWIERLGGGLIADATEGPFDHAAAAIHLGGRLWCSEYTIPIPHLVPLSAHVRRHSGKISVFRVPSLNQKDREELAYRLANNLSGDYEYGNLGLIALSKLAVVRFAFWWIAPLRGWLEKEIRDASRKRTYGICSQHVARAYREIGMPLVNRPEATISPNDLARNPRLEYVGTLEWPSNWPGGAASSRSD